MLNDLNLAVRSLLRRPALLLTSIAILGLGLGATVAVFSMVHGVLVAPLPYTDGEELVVLEHGLGSDTSATVPFSIKEVQELQEQATTFEGVVEHHSMTFTLLGHGDPKRVSTGVVSAGFFDVLGARPLHGRGFLASDEREGAEAVLVLSHPFFQEVFGGDEGVVGQVFEMNNRPHTVVGVLPPIPQYPQDHDVYMPTSACPFRANAARQAESNRSAFRALTVFGRLADGSSPASASAELGRLESLFASENPDTYPPERGYFLQQRPLDEVLVRDSRAALWTLTLAGVLLLLLACSAVANLLVVRGMRAAREQAVRSALGASRTRLVRQALAESLVIAVAGAATGVVVAAASLNLLRTFLRAYTPRAEAAQLDLTVLSFAFGLALVVAAGVTVVLELTRSSGFTALREGTRALAGARSGFVRAGLIVAQVAVAMMLMAGTGLLVKTLYQLQTQNTGVEAQEVMAARLSLNWSRYPNPTAAAGLFDGILDRLGEDARIERAALGSNRPLDGQSPFLQNLLVEGVAPDSQEVAPQTAQHTASENYFDVLGIRVLEGRAFDRGDVMPPDYDPAAPVPAGGLEGLVAVVNQATRDLFFDGREPLGRRISLDGGTNWWTVIGVVDNVRHDLDEDPAPQVYTPLRQRGFANTLVVAGATGVGEDELRRVVTDTVRAVDPEQPVDAFATVAASLADLSASPRTVGRLLAAFALVALLVAAVGLAGVIAYTVSQRQREIGIRMALGARPGGVLAMIWRYGLALTAIGVVFGVVGALAFGRVLQAFLYQTAPGDPWMIGAAVAAMLLVAGAATLVPALRAVRIDPTKALRG